MFLLLLQVTNMPVWIVAEKVAFKQLKMHLFPMDMKMEIQSKLFRSKMK